MKRINLIIIITVLTVCTQVFAQPTAPSGKKWQAVPELTDEFNSFNSNKWQRGHPYWSGRSPSQFNNNNVTYSNGKMQIRASVKNTNQSGDWIWTGCLTSRNKSFKKGMYAEARIKNADLSIVSSFWMQGDYSEIDVIENWGEVKSSQWKHLDYTMEMNTHYFPKPCGWNCDKKTPKHFTNPGNVGNSAQYATYGVWWVNDRTIRFYRNGQLAATATTGGAFNENMYMFFDMEAFTWGPGLPTINDLNNAGKSTAYYDWVHTYKLVDDNGGGSSSNAIPIPGKVEAENYSAMNGIQTQNTSDAGGGKNVGWIGTGDWMDYKVNVQTSGSYTVKFRVASLSNNIKFDLKKGGTTLTSVNSSTTGGWQKWKTVTKTVNLSAGEQTLRILATGPSWNINYMDFAQGSSGGGNTGGGTVITIQAENFASTYGTYNDGHVPYGVNKVNSLGINWVNRGDWVQYNNINIPQQGAYEIVYYISSPVTGSTIDFSVGNTKFNTTTVPNNGQWDSYQALKASNTANFTAGNHNIKLTAGSQDWTWNLDKFTLQRVGAMKNAIEEEVAELSGVNIYPNPAHNTLFVQLTGPVTDEASFRVYNTTGSLVVTDKIQDGFYQLSLEELNSGMYIIKVQNGNNVITKSFIKN